METHNHAPGFYEKVGHGFMDSTKQFPGLPATLPITQLQHHQLPHTMQKQHHSHQIMQHPNQNPSLLQNMNNKQQQQHHADPYFGNSSSMGTVAMNMIPIPMPMHQLQSPQPQVQQQQHPHMTSASSMNNVNGNHGSSFQYSKNVHHGNMNWTGNGTGNGNNGSSSGGGGGSILSMNPNSLRHNGVSGGPMDLLNMNSLYSSPGPGDNNINNHNHILPIGPGGPVSLRPGQGLGPGLAPGFELHQGSGGGRGGFQLKQNNQYYNTGVEMGTLSNPLAAANFPDGGRPRFGPSRDEMKDRLAESLAADNNITCLPGFKTRDDIRVSCVGNYPHMPALNQQQVRQQQQAQAVQLSSRTNPGISNNSGDSTFQRKMFGHDPAAGPGANGNNPAMFHPSRRSAASIAMVGSGGGGGGGGSLPDFNEINRMNGMSMSQFSNLQMMNQACLPPAGISSVGSLHTSTTSYSAGAGGSNALNNRKFREGSWSSMGTPGPCTSTIDDAKAQKEGYRQELEKQIEQTKMRRDEETRRQKDINDHPLGANYNYAQPKVYIPPKFLSSPNLANMEMALRMSDNGNESRMEDPRNRSNSNGSLSYNSSNDTSTFGRFGFGSGFEFGSRSTPQQQQYSSQEMQGQQQRINKPGGHGGASFNSNLSNVGGAQLNSLPQTMKSSSGISNSYPHPPPNYSNSTPNCPSNLNAWNPNYGAGAGTGLPVPTSYSPNQNQNQQHSPVPMPVPVIPPSPMPVPLPVPIPVPGQPWPIYGAPMPQMLPFPPPFPHHHHPPPPPFFPHPPPPPPPHLFQHRLPHQPPPPPIQPPPLQFECGDTGKLSTSTTGANVARENNTGMMQQPDVENLDQLIDELPLKQYTWQTSDQLPDPALKTLIYKEELRRQILQKKKDEEERAVREREEEDKLEQRIREYDERMRREVQEERNRIFVRGNPSLITSLKESTIQSQKSPGQNQSQNHQNRTQQDRGDRGRASVQVPVMSINGEIPRDSSYMETGKTGEKREDVILIQENLTKGTSSNDAAAGYGYGSTTTATTSDQPSASVGVGAGTLNKIGETESRQQQEERRQEQQQQQQQQMYGSGDNSNNFHQKLQQEQHRYSQGHKEKRIEEDFNESGENGNDLENTFEARGRNLNPNPRTNNNGNMGTRIPFLPSVQTQKRLKTQSDSSLAGAGQQNENQFDKQYLGQSQNQNSSACGWDGESKPCQSRNRKLVGERGRNMNLNALSNILNSLGLETRRMERVIQKKINF